MVRSHFLALLAASAAPSPGVDTPSSKGFKNSLSALHRMSTAFASAHTFSARIQLANGDVLADYVSPNRMRLRLLAEEAIIVGDRTFARTPQGYREVLNYQDGFFLRDLALQPRVVPAWAKLGQAISVTTARNGVISEHLYRYFSYDRGAQLVTTIAVSDATHLPDYAIYDAKTQRTVVEYTSFNGPPAFSWPAKV